MVLMLELVGISVFGACLSALFCILIEGTPYEIPKVNRSKEGSLKPRITRSRNWQAWKIASINGNEELTKNFDPIGKKIGPNGRKCSPEVRQDFRSNVKTLARNESSEKNLQITAFQNLNSDTEMKAVKMMRNTEENDCLNSDNSLGSSIITKKPCKYCGNLETPSVKFDFRENRKKLSIVNRSVDMIKSTLLSDKRVDDSCAECSRLYNDKGTKIRMKRIRFIVPKSLVIDRKAKNNVVTDRKVSEEDFFEEFNSRYCYLEALRIKNNKDEKT